MIEPPTYRFTSGELSDYIDKVRDAWEAQRAPEIERLRTANEYAYGPHGELAKLRAALQQIADHAPITYVAPNKIDYSCQRIARATLLNQQSGTEKP